MAPEDFKGKYNFPVLNERRIVVNAVSFKSKYCSFNLNKTCKNALYQNSQKKTFENLQIRKKKIGNGESFKIYLHDSFQLKKG